MLGLPPSGSKRTRLLHGPGQTGVHVPRASEEGCQILETVTPEEPHKVGGYKAPSKVMEGLLHLEAPALRHRQGLPKACYAVLKGLHLDPQIVRPHPQTSVGYPSTPNSHSTFATTEMVKTKTKTKSIATQEMTPQRIWTKPFPLPPHHPMSHKQPGTPSYKPSQPLHRDPHQEKQEGQETQPAPLEQHQLSPRSLAKNLRSSQE